MGATLLPNKGVSCNGRFCDVVRNGTETSNLISHRSAIAIGWQYLLVIRIRAGLEVVP